MPLWGIQDIIPVPSGCYWIFNCIMLLREIKNIFHKELDTLYPKEEVDRFFYMLVEHYLGLERFVLALEPQMVVSKEEEQPLFEGLSQLKLERPIQYILGKAHFMDLEFRVNEQVLIPRPETEELVRWIVSEFIASPILKGQHGKNKGAERSQSLRILDIGTGSGCIAVSLAKNLQGASVYALDTSKGALEVAKKNARDNGVEITFLQADIFTLDSLGVKFDIIVSNPPYVRELEKKKMRSNVKEYEPNLALFVTDKEPLVFYGCIIRFAQTNLKKGGALYFEINQYLGKETQQLLEEQNFLEIELRKDMFGNDRMLKGTMY